MFTQTVPSSNLCQSIPQAWTARLEASLEVATCLMNPDARAAIGNLLPAAVADARAHLESPKPSDMPARRAMLEMAPEVKPLVPKVCPSVSQACRQARRNGHGAPRGGFAGFASPGWYVWQVAAVAFLLRVPVTYALTPAKPAQRLGSPRKRIERSPSSLLLRTLGGLWSRFWYPKVPVRTFLFLGLLHVTVTLSFVAGTYLTSPAFVNPFLGVTSRADYFNPAFAAAKADSLARLVAPPVDVDCSCDGFDYFLVIGVSSAAHAAAERQSARDTWARFGALVPRCPVLVRFIVGRHKNATVMWRVAQEMEEYGDIVQVSLPEYPLAGRAARFGWAPHNHSSCRFYPFHSFPFPLFRRLSTLFGVHIYSPAHGETFVRVGYSVSLVCSVLLN